MRLDKFLKISRLVKRRTVANLLCDGGGVTLNGKVAKASTAVKPSDSLVLHFGNRVMTVTIVDVPTRPVPVQAAAGLYILVSEVRIQGARAIDTETTLADSESNEDD
jgi:ribosomal 50S subunit-recycling heat shock protein